MNNLSGQTLGRYHLIDKQGEGGMAIVYKAFDTRLECEVAVKVIRMERLTQEMMATTLKRFEREAKAVAKLNHPNIVNITDYGEYEGVPYLVMEYLEGGTLKQYLGKPMPYQDAIRLLAPIARALQYAHSHNIVHRDIKPSNILITESGEPMLTDFGIAKILDLQEGQTLTGTGVGIGTPEYMAPEQWSDKITPAVDIYSLGIVFFELVTGHKPYTADTPAAVLIKSVSDPLPRPSSFVVGLPDQVEQLLFKALAKKPEDRYPSMQEFENALERVQVGANTGDERAQKPAHPYDKSDDYSTMDTFATQLEEKIEKKPKLVVERKTMNNQLRLPKTTGNRNKVSLTAGLGILAFGILFVIVGASTNWFKGTTPTVTPTVTPSIGPTQTSEPAATATTMLGIGSTMISPIDKMVMVYVPEGDFLMGLPDAWKEVAEHKVYLDAYWIDKTEVTNAMYAKCVAEGGCTEPTSNYSYTHSTYYGNALFENHPVINIDWYQAQSYCIWAGKVLPTEAQWEKAARGFDGGIYPWGDDIPSPYRLNYIKSLVNDTTIVGSFPAGESPFGALDMAGNVWEWVSDWYDSNYYSNSPLKNPAGPVTGDSRVVRGGSWANDEGFISSFYRQGNDPMEINTTIGFRCLKGN